MVRVRADDLALDWFENLTPRQRGLIVEQAHLVGLEPPETNDPPLTPAESARFAEAMNATLEPRA